jgi:dynein heavy chain
MRKECEQLKKDIQNANNIIGSWVTLQKGWIYLENIFTSAELRKSLQKDAHEFDLVDKFFKSMCLKAAKMPSISRFVKQPQISFDNIET